MTCGHCASTIEKAVKNADQACEIKIELATRKVQVETARSAQDIADAIKLAAIPARWLLDCARSMAAGQSGPMVAFSCLPSRGQNERA